MLLVFALFDFAAVVAKASAPCDSTSEFSLLCETCPVGKFRSSGVRRRGCVKCPRGRYGETEGLETRQCSAACPLGKYNDKLGARSEDDCRLCPPGTFGSETGLTTSACSGNCPSGRYSSAFGVTTDQACITCPAAYRGWQCHEDAIPRKGTFDSTSGAINEEAHAYSGGAYVAQGSSPITFQSKYTLPLKNIA